MNHMCLIELKENLLKDNTQQQQKIQNEKDYASKQVRMEKKEEIKEE